MDKDQFLYQLKQKLQPLDPDLIREILADFEEHFANGMAQGHDEARLADELGNPSEIARQYLESIAEGQSHQEVRTSWQENAYVHADQQAATPVVRPMPARPESSGQIPDSGSAGTPKKINEAALALVIMLNLFFGIPLWLALFSTLIGFWAAAGGIGLASIALFIVALFEAGTIGLILFLFALSLASLTIIGVIAMVYLTRGVCLLLGHYIRWNRKIVTGGASA